MDKKVKGSKNAPAGADDDSYDWSNLNVEIERKGTQIILPGEPAEMDYDAAIAQLRRRKEEEAVVYDVTEFIAGAYWDAGLAFYKAMQRKYGIVTTRGIPTWFGEIKPDLVTIKTGPSRKDVVQLPMGQFNLPNIENPILARFETRDGVPGFLVHSSVRKKEQAILIQLAADAREILQAESIYRGQAIRLMVNDQGQIEFQREPEFLDLANVSERDIVFNRATARLIETNVFTPMKRTELCRLHRIPLKRGILFEGPYGCGKSLTARVAAKVATDSEWTFVTLDRAQGLRQAIEFARLYMPACIFAEDIDRVADRSDNAVNDLINLLDGIITKDMEIMVVLTTNFIDKIDKSLLRPGRFDAVIRIDAPDQEAVIKLMHYYGGDLVAKDADLNDAATELAGQIPATIREVVERAKLSMILDERESIQPEDMFAAAVGMARHLELLSEKEPEPSVGDQLAKNLQALLVPGSATADPKLKGQLDLIQRASILSATRAGEATNVATQAAQAAGGASARTIRLEEKIDAGAKTLDKVHKTVKEIEGQL